MKSGTASSTPHALTPRQQCPRSGGTRQRRLLCVATTTPQSRHLVTTRCRLKVFSQATTRGPIRRHDVGSRFPLKMRPGADGYGSGRMSVAFFLAWLMPPLELLQTDVDLRHKARGPCASTKVEPANDRPSPRSVLVRTSTRPSAAQGVKLASAHYERPSGWLPSAAGNGRATPIQSQRICSHVI